MAGRCILPAHPQTRQERSAARRGQSKATPDISSVLVTARGSCGPCVGQTLDPPVIFRVPNGLFTENGGPSKLRTKRFGEPPASASPPERSAQMRHRAGFMIADAVRYMSVHSWKQPDSHGRSGTPQRQKQQPARPGIPSSRAVSAGSGRCWVRTSVGLADGFTVTASPPIGMAADLQLLHFPPHENRILSAPCPCVSSRPGQLTEGSRCPSKEVQQSPTGSHSAPLPRGDHSATAVSRSF